MKFIDLTGQKFGKLTVIERGKNTSDGHVKWKCICSCGNTSNVRAKTLRNGKTKSCGCGQAPVKHAMSRTRIYQVWAGIIARCHNPNDTGYKWYGDLGVSVCDRWRYNFANFFEDMGDCPRGMSIDRIDNKKGYYKQNCRWATTKEQNFNKKNTIKEGQNRNGWIIIKRIQLSYPYKTMIKCSNCGKTITRSISAIRRKCTCHKK